MLLNFISKCSSAGFGFADHDLGRGYLNGGHLKLPPPVRGGSSAYIMRPTPKRGLGCVGRWLSGGPWRCRQMVLVLLLFATFWWPRVCLGSSWTFYYCRSNAKARAQFAHLTRAGGGFTCWYLVITTRGYCLGAMFPQPYLDRTSFRLIGVRSPNIILLVLGHPIQCKSIRRNLPSYRPKLHVIHITK